MIAYGVDSMSSFFRSCVIKYRINTVIFEATN